MLRTTLYQSSIVVGVTFHSKSMKEIGKVTFTLLVMLGSTITEPN